MSDPNCKEKDAPNSLSNRDTIELPDDLSLSDSDSDEPTEHFGRKVEDLSSSSEEEGEMQQHVLSVPQENPTFRLIGGSSGFCDRSKDIFAQLDSAAKITSKDLGEDNILDGTFARPAPPSPPQVPQRKCVVDQEATKKEPPGKKLPDYLAHPERWTRYSLEDIAETSDRKNSQVAHQYIQGLQDSRRSQKATLETFTPAFNQDRSSSENKIVFTKPKSKDQSGSKLDHAKKEEVGLQHLDDPHISWRKEEKKRKWGTEKKDEDKMVSSVVFNSSKKVNRKHFRKTLEDDEGGTE
ncbi:protein TSSC4 [Ctenopharyngodon idella]|uniref:protein TSSC4 n=1 Tax=Ctenopharyngodon idella TaxID=7959 RepID=UPI0022322437|nr:protein TSSC4 [Ctenopharyngodon idella]XP_051757737.1 protein TSSC4 [Ctenopharyngodon idella]XP_051757739.1 protein TSSC4 [Ctenopharyngodon idella]XP_051757740.1 protein TSSC4 [Ctenopharyngodon idella]XP_051757741.1 protein TSSC4 [Ctenopharyngodon idella]XP_051757742.1 protein TSSC4 [Ctenopharyngodon idella]XP_051757743.1 protein TSSC4 [Ctenopharyngodon idella]XP_051757744.1 protein TSSC4 [Ctenopharyngodon idella]